MKRLGIIITSTNDLPMIQRPVLAARSKGVDVEIHLTGDGMLSAGHPIFDTLHSQAMVSICRKSALHKDLFTATIQHLAELMTADDPITRMLARCDHNMIFQCPESQEDLLTLKLTPVSLVGPVRRPH